MKNIRQQIDLLIESAVKKSDMDALKSAYGVMVEARECRQISAQDAQVFESMFESAAEMIEEQY